MDKKKLFIGGLPWSMSSHSLQELFTKFGEIIECIIISDTETGRSKGFGFITFAKEEEAANAQKEMDGKEIEGRNIVVNFAKPKVERNNTSRPFRNNTRRY